MRIAHIADMHLSRSHGYFFENWEVVLETLNGDPPDLVVIGGDVSFNGADNADDLYFARKQIDRLTVPTVVIPGNHDIGDHPRSRKLDQPVNAERLARWFDHFDNDRFVMTVDGWRIVGCNTELIGSGLAREEEQWEWLAAELGDRSTPVLLILHKPLFARDDYETNFNKSCVDPVGRRRFWALLRDSSVEIVASAHVHVYKHVRAREIGFVWCPATSFIVSWQGKEAYDGARLAGYVCYEVDHHASTMVHWLVEPDRLVNYDLRNWFRRYGSTVKLPPRPLSDPTW